MLPGNPALRTTWGVWQNLASFIHDGAGAKMQRIGQQGPSTTELGDVRGEKPRGLQLQVKLEVLQTSGFSGGVFKSE